MGPSTQRLVSLDAFRGLTIAAMILVNNPGNWDHVYPPLLHAEWHGWTLTDLIFPFFLFVVGVAMTFSLPRQQAAGGVYARIARRVAVIFALGLLLNAVSIYGPLDMRFAGVLQRIAIVYGAASLIFLHTSRRSQAWWTASLLLGYWALLELVPVPGAGAGVLTPEGSLASWFDRTFLPGRLWPGEYDPEGILSTIPAIATTLMGVLAGYWIRSDREGSEIAAGMFTAGWVLILAGLVWSIWLPINKNLWTSSYVLFTAGAALEGLAFCYWLIDVRGYRRWARPAIVFGLNPIAVFVLSSLVAKTMILVQVGSGNDAMSLKQWIYSSGFASWLSPMDASLAFALSYLVLWLGLMTVLYRKGIFIKV